MPYIYKITNKINKKIYIGKTTLTVEGRWKEHCRDYKRERYEKRPLYSAMRKYGIDNFFIEEVEKCDIELLNKRECFWIEYYGSFKNGYNATKGGDGTTYADYDLIYQLYLSGKTIKEIGKLTNYCTDTISKALHIKGVSTEKLQSRAIESISKSVIMIDKNTDKELRVFSSIKEAQRFLGINYTTHISEVCKGKRKTCQGYKWKYLK